MHIFTLIWHFLDKTMSGFIEGTISRLIRKENHLQLLPFSILFADYLWKSCIVTVFWRFSFFFSAVQACCNIKTTLAAFIHSDSPPLQTDSGWFVSAGLSLREAAGLVTAQTGPDSLASQPFMSTGHMTEAGGGPDHVPLRNVSHTHAAGFSVCGRLTVCVTWQGSLF